MSEGINNVHVVLERIIWLIPMLPMLASLFIAIGIVSEKNKGESGERKTALIVTGAALASFILVCAVDVHALAYGLPGHIHIASWFASGSYQVNISFNLDMLAMSMMNLVTIISILMIRFSVNYMHREAGFQRFFMIISLFMGAMLIIVMSGNVVLTFTGWEIAGVCSYLLIAYVYNRPTAVQNATRVFVTNRIGDVGLVLAIFLSFQLTGTLQWTQILTTSNSLTPLGNSILALSFLLAAMVKSAQVPFSPWITRALEGPTPSSAIFYGSLMIHAGVYLIIRIEPILVNSPLVMTILMLIGLLTTIYAFFSNLVQTDVKSNLIYSTLSHVGLMFFSCGMGWFELASWHLVLHSIWRAYQFLHAPALMHLMNTKTRPVNSLIKSQSWLYTASLNRFWLDSMANWLIVRPIDRLAHDAERFDDKVINKLIGMPEQTMAITSVVEWENQKHVEGDTHSPSSLTEDSLSKAAIAKNTIELSDKAKQGAKVHISRGIGFAGKIMEKLADILFWFEEHLVLKSGGEGLLKVLNHIGYYLLQIEELLSQPRYLIILILATFITII